jgi:hypothetical protein
VGSMSLLVTDSGAAYARSRFLLANHTDLSSVELLDRGHIAMSEPASPTSSTVVRRS